MLSICLPHIQNALTLQMAGQYALDAMCAMHTFHLLVQVDMAAAGRAAVQRRAPPGTEAVALPGGSPIFAAVIDDGNKVLQEAMPPLQVSGCLLCHHSGTCKTTTELAAEGSKPLHACACCCPQHWVCRKVHGRLPAQASWPRHETDHAALDTCVV